MEGFERCTNPDIDISITQAVFGSVTDVFLLLLPVVQVMRLHMPLRKRLGVAAIFMSGLLVLPLSPPAGQPETRAMSTNELTSFTGPCELTCVRGPANLPAP